MRIATAWNQRGRGPRRRRLKSGWRAVDNQAMRLTRDLKELAFALAVCAAFTLLFNFYVSVSSPEPPSRAVERAPVSGVYDDEGGDTIDYGGGY